MLMALKDADRRLRWGHGVYAVARDRFVLGDMPGFEYAPIRRAYLDLVHAFYEADEQVKQVLGQGRG